MARFRDVKDVVVHGNSWTGVQDVSFNFDNDKFDNSGDDSKRKQKINLTKLRVPVSISVKDPQHKRDLRNGFFGGHIFTSTHADNTLNKVAHGLENGYQIRVYTDDTLPGGLSEHTNYFVVEKTDDDFKVSLTSGGSAVTLSNDGTGTHKFMTKFNEVQKADASENASEILDSSEDDAWITFAETTDEDLQASIEFRDIEQVLNTSLFPMGHTGRLVFEVLLGAVNSGLADNSKFERFTLDEMTIDAINPQTKHKELATATIGFNGVGGTAGAVIENTLSEGGSTPFEINTGDKNTVAFVAPAVTGGDDANVSVANCLCTSVSISATHGGLLERSFDFIAHSADGQNTPVTKT